MHGSLCVVNASDYLSAGPVGERWVRNVEMRLGVQIKMRGVCGSLSESASLMEEKDAAPVGRQTCLRQSDR